MHDQVKEESRMSPDPGLGKSAFQFQLCDLREVTAFTEPHFSQMCNEDSIVYIWCLYDTHKLVLCNIQEIMQI